MGSFARIVCCVLLLLPLAACNQGKGDVNLDSLKIDAGRLSSLIGRSSDGLDLQPAKPLDTRDLDAAKRLEIDRALRDAALKVLLLRNRLLFEDVIGEREARATQWPSWILQPQESALSPVDLNERYEWLNAEVKSLAERGCRIGREKSHDPKFCAVR